MLDIFKRIGGFFTPKELDKNKPDPLNKIPVSFKQEKLDLGNRIHVKRDEPILEQAKPTPQVNKPLIPANLAGKLDKNLWKFYAELVWGNVPPDREWAEQTGVWKAKLPELMALYPEGEKSWKEKRRNGKEGQ